MYISLLPVSLLLSLAAAATTTISGPTTVSAPATSSTSCAAQPVMDACFASTSAIADGCATTDYGCLCTDWAEVLKCFLQCPNDPRLASAQASRDTYCNDVVAYGGTTTAPISRSVAPVTTITTSTPSTARTTQSTGTVKVVSSTIINPGSSSTGSAKNGAEELAVGAGSVLIGLAGIVGAFL